MNEVSIRLEANRRFFQAGETLKGTVTWSADTPPKAVEVRLFWFTLGKAPQQIGLVQKNVIKDPVARDTRQFQFTLPAAPWSFRGRLAGLSWAVEAKLLPTQANAHAIFQLSPDGKSLRLHRSWMEEDVA